MDRRLRSQLGKAYLNCRPQASLYGKCVEGHHVNKSLAENACKQQREELRQCVEAERKKISGGRGLMR